MKIDCTTGDGAERYLHDSLGPEPGRRDLTDERIAYRTNGSVVNGRVNQKQGSDAVPGQRIKSVLGSFLTHQEDDVTHEAPLLERGTEPMPPMIKRRTVRTTKP